MKNNVTKKNFLLSELSGIMNFPLNFVRELKMFPKTMSDSKNEFKRLNTIIFCGILGAVSIVLKLLTSINFGPFMITYSWIPGRVADYMFGPVVGAIYAGVMNIINFIIKPMGNFNLIYTIIPMLAGFIFGLILYRKPVSFFRIFFAQAIVKIFINAGLTTYVMSFERGKAFMYLLPARLVKNLIMIPVDSIILFVVLTAVIRVIPRIKKN